MTPDVNEQPDGSVCKHGALARVCLSCELEATVADLERQLAERTRERDDARTYCAGLASYICEPIYDDVANRCGVQADAQAAAGGAAVERWANADKQRLRAESAERQVEKMLDRLFERGEMALAPCFACGYNGPNYFQPDVHPCAARHHAALAPAQQEGGK